MSNLILVRHGESEYNAKSLWTGLTDVALTDKGRSDCHNMAAAIKDLHPDAAYTSVLSRAIETLNIILHDNQWANVPVTQAPELNERDYGELTGLNKWEVKEKYGEQKFNDWRRGWDIPLPGGETLKDVYSRAVPYFEQHILPDLKTGHDVLISAHGNTLRALIKHFDGIGDDQVHTLEVPFGEVRIYNFDQSGTITGHQTRKVETVAPPA